MRKNVQQQSGRWAGQDARDYRGDGRKPKYKANGKIRGRFVGNCDSGLATVRAVCGV